MRESYCDGIGKVKKRTLANLSCHDPCLIELMRRHMKGETFVFSSEVFQIVDSKTHGHVQAVRGSMRCLKIAALIGPQSGPERDRIMAMIAARILAPHSKLSTVRFWHSTTLASAGSLPCGSSSIRALEEQSDLQLSLFDEGNLFEFQAWEYPGERLIVCRNPFLADKGGRVRQELLSAAENDLSKVRDRVSAGRLKGDSAIGLAVGRVIDRRKMKKHFIIEISQGRFNFRRNEESIAREASLDGVYVIRSSVEAEKLSADDVEWHMREAWRGLTFADERKEAGKIQDPVVPPKKSGSAKEKASSKKTADGQIAHSFKSLLNSFSTIVLNVCRFPAEAKKQTFTMTTTPSPNQQKALNLLKNIKL